MKTQVVCSKPRKDSGSNASGIDYVSLRDIYSIDEYDVTVLDLTAPEIWCNDGEEIDTIDQENHFKSISYMIANSEAPILICLPQNIGFKHRKRYDNKIITTDLKDMIKEYEVILNSLFQPLFAWGLRYENTVTTIENQDFKAAFYFSSTPDGWVIYKSKSNRAVLINYENIYVTTLSIEKVDKLKLVLGVMGLMDEQQEIPDWMKNYPMSEEEQRYAREGFSSDEELSIYDLLFSENLSKSDIDKIKKMSKDLLQKIKERIAGMDHWTDKQETRAAVDVLIRNVLYEEIPDSMFDRLEAYRKAIYEHIYTHYKQAA